MPIKNVSGGLSSLDKEKDSKKYQNISPEIRLELIQKVLSKQCTIKQAAEDLSIKFSTAKVILQTFRKEGRVGKKKTRIRKTKDILAAKQEQEKKPIIKVELNKYQKRVQLQDRIDQLQKELKQNQSSKQNLELRQDVGIPERSVNIQENNTNIFIQPTYTSFQDSNFQQSQDPNVLMHYQMEIIKQRQLNSCLMQLIQKNQLNNINQFSYMPNPVVNQMPIDSIRSFNSFKSDGIQEEFDFKQVASNTSLKDGDIRSSQNLHQYYSKLLGPQSFGFKNEDQL